MIFGQSVANERAAGKKSFELMFPQKEPIRRFEPYRKIIENNGTVDEYFGMGANCFYLSKLTEIVPLHSKKMAAV